MSISWQNIIKLPVKYDKEKQWIVDTEGDPILEIRGYGKISSKLNYNVKESNRLQNEFAEYIVNRINN